MTGETARHRARTDGRTDRESMAGMLAEHGSPAHDWPQTMSALERAGEGHRETLSVKGTALPGVVELVTALSKRTGMVQTVVTGNVRPNAEVKLGALGLGQFLDLDIGGYGSDHSDRYRLVEVARHRAPRSTGRPMAALALRWSLAIRREMSKRRSLAALAFSPSLPVFMGSWADELLPAGAPRVFDDLTATADVLAYLFSA